MKCLLLLLVTACVGSSAVAQPSIEPWALQWNFPPDGSHLAKLLDVVPSGSFEIVVTLDSGEYEFESIEFSLRDLGYPWVVVEAITLAEAHFENTGPPNSYQFRIEFNGCTSPCEQREIVRIRIKDIPGWIPSNTHVELYGFEGPGTVPRGRLCRGEYIDVPMDGPVGLDGFEVPTLPGAVVLNWWGPCSPIGRYCGLAESPHVECDQVVSGLPESITSLKSRFVN